jgi:hypothetical protein
LRCDLLRPCVAFHSGVETYLVHEERLYRLATERAPYSVREKMPTAPDRARFLASFDGRQEKLISLGGDLLGTALPVQP